MARRAAKGGTGVHLTFGEDPATSVVVSWLTADEPPRSRTPWAARPAVRFAPADTAPDSDAGGAEATAPAGPASEVSAEPASGVSGAPGERVTHAETRTYRDAQRRKVHVQHARLRGLQPDTRYRYVVEPPLDDGEPSGGEFRTGPAAETAFTFTCFGDHGTDQPEDPYGSPASGEVVTALDSLDPLFQLVLGDLSYASLRESPPRAWQDWFQMIAPSARRRPWMPVAGNHETERDVGKYGLDSYQAYFDLPANGAGRDYEGLWYAFTVGRARFVVVVAEDVCYQAHGLVYLRGFSDGRQTAWLTRTLAAARQDPTIDWVIVAMHQVAMSSAAHHNGGDLLLRREWLPIFDRHQVDLVLCGHEHHYERTVPVRGVVPGAQLLTPRPATGQDETPPPPAAEAPTTQEAVLARQRAHQARTATVEVVDTTVGTVHLTLGTGGSSTPSADALLHPPAGRVVIEPEVYGGRQRSIHADEPAPWLAARSSEHPYAFAAFTVDPGTPGATTTIRLTLHDTFAPDAPPFDEVLFTRPRADSA